MELIAFIVILFLFVLVMIIDEVRMRRERIIVCTAIADALEACHEKNKQGANSLAFDIAQRLNQRGWKIEL